METFAFGIILLAAAFFVFLLVGRNLSRGLVIILGLYLLLMLLLSNFQALPTPVTTSVFGCLFGTFAGHIYSSFTAKNKEE